MLVVVSVVVAGTEGVEDVGMIYFSLFDIAETGDFSGGDGQMIDGLLMTILFKVSFAYLEVRYDKSEICFSMSED
jgi:hypothetical protein